MKISVILSSYNRGPLLERSLHTYVHQTVPRQDFEVIISDDQSTDNTSAVIEKFKDKLNVIQVALKNPERKFRSQSVGWNVGLSLAVGEVCLFSHPEIMMPRETLEKMYDLVQSFDQPVFVTMKPYVLSPACQKKIDWVDWESDVNLIKTIPEFYQDTWSDDGKRIWTNKKMEDPKLKWESNTTFTMRRLDLLSIGGFEEFDRWGPDDPDFLQRRKTLKIPTVVVIGLLNFHQNHDDLSPPERKQNFRVKWYPTRGSAKLRVKDHKGEYQVISSYRD